MRIVCYDDYRVGVLDAGDGVHDLTDLLPDLAAEAAAPYRVNALIERWELLREEAVTRANRRSGRSVHEVRLRAATPRPRNFLAAPLNYVDHNAEMRGPVASGAGTARDLGFFVKASGSVSGAAEGVELPPINDRRFDHEGEIGVVIGRRAAGVSRDRALAHVFGYTLVLDGTMRMTEAQREERTMRKSFSTFGACGPAIVTADQVPDPATLSVRLSVNDKVRQDGSLADLIVGVPELVAWASSVLPLEPGDLIATGSPSGVGPMQVGDTVTIESEPIGRLVLAVSQRGW